MASAAVHSVHIYSENSDLITRLCGIVSSSLRVGDAVLVVATSEHRVDLVKELERSGVELRAHAREGRFTMLDAEEMLSAFLVDNAPDQTLFEVSVGAVLQRARASSKSSATGLTVFGEMVAVLWDQGKKEAALQLEMLWNDILNHHSFHLHCAYPRAGFIGGDEQRVCNLHSHLLQ